MVEILDRIYEVFAQIEEAKKSQNDFEVTEKEKELDLLRAELVNSSRTKVPVLSSPLFNRTNKR